MKLAIVDLDGVVANVDARFAKAEEARREAMPDLLEDALTLSKEQERDINNIYWRTVFNPELVTLDTLIEGAREAVSAIEQHEEDEDIWQVIYLTSRPEPMREATWNWLYEHHLAGPRIIMKPSAFQYTKTAVWKAGMVQMLASFYGASRVLVVDDEQANLNEIVRQATTPPQVPGLIIAKSLGEAVAKLDGTWVEPDPFLPAE